MIKKILFVFVLLAVAVPIFAAAQINLNLDYPTFAGIDLNTNQNLNTVVAWLYYFIVGIAGLAAFVMIVWGGIQWLTSGAIPSQASEARDKLRSAILGLLLILASFLIIQVINPQLTLLNQPGLTQFFGTVPGITLQGPAPVTGCGTSAVVDIKARDVGTTACTGSDGPFTFADFPSGQMVLEWTAPAASASCEAFTTTSGGGVSIPQTVPAPSGSQTVDPVCSFAGSTDTYTIECFDSSGASLGSDDVIVSC